MTQMVKKSKLAFRKVRKRWNINPKTRVIKGKKAYSRKRDKYRYLVDKTTLRDL